MIISNANELALAIVSSSGPELSIDDKIKLYKDSLEAIEIHNKPFIEDEKKKRAENSKALRRALGRGESIF
ncbi:TPA: hypothetical protein U1Z40_002103 [Streptococcus suis]|uniref:hypothetical protein n=1 Tax=Streptococcus suis TaxID=1307 RepID=UPI000CF443A8|nr:hypothetical protein [Streptococcus suis]MCK4044784.1 hypothetical protein [Streptococcus suis]HEL2265197.1 hypothetical protein [Streptococcus suis]HEL2299416.1 hypothetical protein [Streptococcus suis]HEM4568804.1 hypothetical protein [Streptococcus suis]